MKEAATTRATPAAAPSPARTKRPQRRAEGRPETSAIPSIVREVLASPGQPLDANTRAATEARFGHDFSRVRVHADAQAASSAESIGASAYTVGSDVVFGTDRYSPGTPAGRRLLAHELAHVVQQGRGGAAVTSLNGRGPLEDAAERAATRALDGGGPVAVAGASAPGLMCQPNKKGRGRFDDEEDEPSPREKEKEKTQQRKRERARAGRQETQITQAEAERELRALEKSYKEPGAQTRSLKTKTADLKRFQRLLKLAGGTRLEKSQRQGAFDELQRTPTTTAGAPQTKHVAGGEQLPDQELRAGKDKYAQPDYSVYRRRKDGTLERVHVNLKSDQIDLQTPAKARATARAYLAQAVKNSRHLPEGEGIVISFARAPAKEVQEEMKHELFKKGSPIVEVRFGTATHKRKDYKPPAQPPQKPAKSRTRKQRKAKAQKPPAKKTPAKKAKATPQKTAQPKVRKSPAKAPAKPAAKKVTGPKAPPKKSVPRPVAPKPQKVVAPATVRPAAAKPATVKTAAAKAQVIRPVAPKTVGPVAVPKSAAPGRGSRFSGVGGRGIGVLISLAASFIASEAQASVEKDRFTKGYGVDSRYIEKEVEAKLIALSGQFVEHHARHPGTTLYANVTINVHTFDGYVVAGDDAVTWTDYEGTTLESVELGTKPVDKTRVERDGSAARGGSDTYRYITYPVKLAEPPMEEVVAYAKLTGMDLKALRAYAVGQREGASQGRDDRASAHWSDVVGLIDASDVELVIRAHTERLPTDDVRGYLALKAERIEKSIDVGAYPREAGAISKLVDQAEKARELQALLDAPFEDVVDYAKQNGMGLEPLRRYAAHRAEQAGKSGDAGAGTEASAYWSQMVRYIDSL